MTLPNEAISQEPVTTGASDQSGATQTGGASADGTSGTGAEEGAVDELQALRAEVAEVKAGRDRDNAQSRQNLAEASLRNEVAEATSREERQQAVDNARVEAGELTQHEANSMSQSRVNQEIQGIKSRHEQQSASEGAMDMLSQGDQAAALVKAVAVAKENGLDAEEFLAAVEKEKPKSPEAMEFLGAKIGLAKDKAALKGTERYDSGRASTNSVSVDSMSPEEKIRRGVAAMGNRK